MENVDTVLIMTSEPDGRGQDFLPAMIEKIRAARQLAPSLEIWADGVNVAVMGRAVFEETERRP